MICENVDFKFGLSLNISLNSLNQKKKFNRSFKLIWLLEGRITYENSNLKTGSSSSTGVPVKP
ncbi:MAG: AraC family transcriptional regulator, partial [Halanaerobium sp. 4-GBenrich]